SPPAHRRRGSAPRQARRGPDASGAARGRQDTGRGARDGRILRHRSGNRSGQGMISLSELSALLQVLMVDLVLAGDNAIVVGMVAAGLRPEERSRVIMIGIVAATLMRVAFALITAQLLQIIGLLLAGGLLLLWVCWKLWREIEAQRKEHAAVDRLEAGAVDPGEKAPPKTFAQAVLQIVIADVSMSLDNVLAVA